MLFNPDITKQAQEVIFSRKSTITNHPTVFFNKAPVAHTSCQKHLGMHLDEKLNFNTHVKEKITKANNGIGVICKLAHVLPRESLITTIYKSFVRPHIDCGDIIYDQPNNISFCDMIEKVQYNTALAITGAIKGTSQLKLYKELGFESLKFRRWLRRLCFFYKLKTTFIPKYLHDLIPDGISAYNTRNQDNIETYYCRADLFKYSFFPYTIVEWNKLDNTINSKPFLIFRNSLLKTGRPIQNSIFKIHDPLGIKLLTRLRLGLSHLNEHRFRHNFQDCLNPLCSCSLEVESTVHYFLHCHYFIQYQNTLLDSVEIILNDDSNITDDSFVNIL